MNALMQSQKPVVPEREQTKGAPSYGNRSAYQTTILPGGKIEISAPELLSGMQADVFVVIEGEEPVKKRHALDIISEFRGHGVFKTAEEVDAYIREERDLWDS
jgi:hypothetical protein